MCLAKLVPRFYSCLHMSKQKMRLMRDWK
uniref:Uncharacterized protein n=1 Tax=Arundo donax TaxID=35708 RepID=A0A0A9AYF1_ARUDO